MELKYLFTAEYDDGTSFSQTEEDVSRVDPQRSAFYDVLNSGKRVMRFHLDGQGHRYTVDLRDGSFAGDGPSEFLEREEPPETPSEYRLIFYRQHQHHFRADTHKQIGHEVTYVIGWQATIGGQNFQQTMGVV